MLIEGVIGVLVFVVLRHPLAEAHPRESQLVAVMQYSVVGVKLIRLRL